MAEKAEEAGVKFDASVDSRSGDITMSASYNDGRGNYGGRVNGTYSPETDTGSYEARY